ncbi:hypothetical protein PCANC_18334, partial [Puccinia coronata f. sp. avenae]
MESTHNYVKHKTLNQSHLPLQITPTAKTINPNQPAESPPVEKTIPVQEDDEDEPEIVEPAGQKRAPAKNQGVVQKVASRTGMDVTVDLDQDSEGENELAQSHKPKDKTNDKDGFDHPRLYFYPLGEGPNQDENSTAFCCKWCPNKFKVSGHLCYNLKSHRDGANNRGSIQSACPGRSKAIAAGANLLPTAAKSLKDKSKAQPQSTGNLVAYTSKALQAHLLYLEQQTQVLKAINASESRISLVSDVWTTKGSHKAFIGIMCCYIAKDWTYVCQHLAIKYVSWHHNGKYLVAPLARVLTTDSGSDNFTMARGVADIISTHNLTNWDALNLPKDIVRPEKSDQYFPVLASISKGSEDVDEAITKIHDTETSKDGDEDIDPDTTKNYAITPGIFEIFLG